MANSDTKEKILEIQVNYDKAIQGLSEYMGKLEEVNAEEKKLRETIKESGKSTDEQRKRLAAIKAAQDEYKSAIRDLNKEVQNNIKHEKEQDGSLRSLRAQLSNATKDFDSLSKAEREGAKGKALAKHINELRPMSSKRQRPKHSASTAMSVIMKSLSRKPLLRMFRLLDKFKV